MLTAPGCELASKIKAARCISNDFHALAPCAIQILPAMDGSHDFAKRLIALRIKHIPFSPPSGLNKSYLCRFCSRLSLRCWFGSLIFLPPSRISFSLVMRVSVALRARFAKNDDMDLTWMLHISLVVRYSLCDSSAKRHPLPSSSAVCFCSKNAASIILETT